MSWDPKKPVQSPCGPDPLHILCRQFGYCLWAQSPEGQTVDTFDRINAYLMAGTDPPSDFCIPPCTLLTHGLRLASAGTHWAFVFCAAMTYYLYKDGDLNAAYVGTYPTVFKYFAYALIINGIPSMFPSSYNILIANIFQAKVFANAVWNVPLVMGAIALFEGNVTGVGLFEFALGWSVSMFVTTGARENKLMCYPAAVVFTGIAIALATPASAPACFPYLLAACYLFGFMIWDGMEGWPHIDVFGVYPDVRSWKWKGPEITYNPNKKIVPSAWAK